MRDLNSSQPMQVAILGASPKPDRYAHKAMKALAQQGHQVVLINPLYKDIDGLPCYPSLSDARTQHPVIDTITVYVDPRRSEGLGDEIRAAAPTRVIFNPGTEAPDLADVLAPRLALSTS